MESGTRNKSRDMWSGNPKRTMSRKNNLDKYLRKCLEDFLEDTPRPKLQAFVQNNKQDLPPYLKVDFCDVIIFFHESDREAVEELKDYLEKNFDAVVELYSKHLVPVENKDSEAPKYDCRFHFKHKKKKQLILSACGFVYLTADFKEHLWPVLSQAKYFNSAVYELTVIPVLPESKDSLGFQIPMGLSQLRPLNHHRKDDDIYRSKLQTLVKEKANLRSAMAERQFRAQLEFLYRKFTASDNSTDESSDDYLDDETVTPRSKVAREHMVRQEHSPISHRSYSRDSGFPSEEPPSSNGQMSYHRGDAMRPHDAYQTGGHSVYNLPHRSEHSAPTEHDSLELPRSHDLDLSSMGGFNANFVQLHSNQNQQSLQPRAAHFSQGHYSEPMQHPVSREISQTISYNCSPHSGPQVVGSLNLPGTQMAHPSQYSNLPSHYSMNSVRSSGSMQSPPTNSQNVARPMCLSQPLVLPNQSQPHSSMPARSFSSEGGEYHSSRRTYSGGSSMESHHQQFSNESGSYSSSCSSQGNSTLSVDNVLHYGSVANNYQTPGVPIPHQGHTYPQDQRLPLGSTAQRQQDRCKVKRSPKGHKGPVNIIINDAGNVQIGDQGTIVTRPQATQADVKQSATATAAISSMTASSSLAQDGEITSPRQNIQSDHSNMRDSGSQPNIPRTPDRAPQHNDNIPPQHSGNIPQRVPHPQVNIRPGTSQRTSKETGVDNDYRYQLNMNALEPENSLENSLVEDMGHISLDNTDRKPQFTQDRKERPVAKIAPISATFNNGYQGTMTEGGNPNHYQNNLLYAGEMPGGMFTGGFTGGFTVREEEEIDVKDTYSEETSVKRL